MKKNNDINQERIPLSSNSFDLNSFNLSLRESVTQHFFNEKNKVREFEIAIQEKLKTNKEVVCLSSGTAAIHMALLLAGVQKGDYVICQSFTYIASVNPVCYVGAKPIFIDSCKETWNIDPNLLENTLKDLAKKGIQPKALIAVNIYGMPCDMKKILRISKKYNLKVIEDAAESFGAKIGNSWTGTLGDYGIISFNNNKILSAGGGGALICGSKEEKNRVLFFANQARENGIGYLHRHIGYNYRLSNIQAILGLSQLKFLNANIKCRKSVNKFYNGIFKYINGVNVFNYEFKENTTNYWLTCIVIDRSIEKFTNKDILLALDKEKIESRLLWKPMHLQPLFKDELYFGNNVAKNLFERGLCLPSGSNLSENEKKRIKVTLLQFFNAYI